MDNVSITSGWTCITHIWDRKCYKEDKTTSENKEGNKNEYRYRSYSDPFPYEYPPEFVPRPKPKISKELPSPMILSGKNEQQRTNNNQISLNPETEKMCFSCPDEDEVNTVSQKDASHSSNQRIQIEVSPITLKTTRRIMGKIKYESSQNISKEYENIIRHEKMYNDSECADALRLSQNDNVVSISTEDEYERLKVPSESAVYRSCRKSILLGEEEFPSSKKRSMTILERLVSQADVKRKFSENEM